MKKGIIIILITLTVSLVGLTKVNADTLTGNDIVMYYSDSAKTNQLPFPNGTSGVQYYELTGTGNNIETALIYTSRSFVKDSNTKYIRIPFMVTGNTWATSTNFLDREVICDWVQNENYTYQPYNCRYWGTGTYASPVDANIKINVSLYSTSEVQTPCIIEDDNIKCELLNNQVYNAIYFKYSISQTNTTYPVRLNFNRAVNFYTDNTQEIINNQNQNTQEIINQNATYSDEPKEETEGKNETTNYEQKEQALMGNLDFNMTAMDNITINPNASAFIWQIADRLRSINPAIILLMTSILGMGLIKLILNR